MNVPADVRSARELSRAVAERDPALPDLGVVLDAGRRDEAFGGTTTLERLRYKRGAAIVAAVRDARGDPHWIVSYADAEKLSKSIRRAAGVGAATRRVTPRVLAGPAYADRLLASAVRRVFGAEAASFDGADVLRYNPQRRLVVRRDGAAIKIAAGPSHVAAASLLAARGLPVLAPETLGESATRTPWWGTTDLAHAGGRALSHRAGEVLARIHATPPEGLALETLDASAVARESAEAIAVLLPEAGERAGRLATALSGLRVTGGVLSHGDWSPDQVLVGGGDVRVIDLDRVVVAPPERDLATFLVCGGDAAMLDGYRAAGGSFDADAIAGWQALAQLQRAVEPFRRGSDAWPEELEHAVARAEELIR
ncbi:aminoglycoside phosphotransferase family protein [Microbacterium betulae]|uniref:Aminoglycoside phosphotransferase family protein n=1 Tax=Microbacterium betulae TaxID=2981139 RepID=A0AA97FFN9_9MICO|nr:aminoglycoside phosphotransferase family protein [Microbacterium sp. AB]WOF21768.1 aminoglycoside phosphotransferase family protein [Microbacterium sp. AB]